MYCDVLHCSLQPAVSVAATTRPIMSCPFNSTAGFQTSNIQLPSQKRQQSGLNSAKIVYPPDSNVDSYSSSLKGRGISDSTVLQHTSEYRTSLGVDASAGYHNIALSVNDDTDSSIYGSEYKPRFNHTTTNGIKQQYGVSVSGKPYTKPITYWDYVSKQSSCFLR